jgi:hypothetical protein
MELLNRHARYDDLAFVASLLPTRGALPAARGQSYGAKRRSGCPVDRGDRRVAVWFDVG